MCIVDTDDHLPRWCIADQPVDHLAHPAQRIGAEIAGDVDKCAQRDTACRGGADDPMPSHATRTTLCDGLACQPRLADTGGAGQHDPAGAVGGSPRGLGDYRKLF